MWIAAYFAISFVCAFVLWAACRVGAQSERRG